MYEICFVPRLFPLAPYCGNCLGKRLYRYTVLFTSDPYAHCQHHNTLPVLCMITHTLHDHTILSTVRSDSKYSHLLLAVLIGPEEITADLHWAFRDDRGDCGDPSDSNKLLVSSLV